MRKACPFRPVSEPPWFIFTKGDDMKKTSLCNDLTVTSIILALSVILFSTTFSMESVAVDFLGPSFFPRLVSIALMVLSGAYLFTARKTNRKAEEADKSVASHKDLLSLGLMAFYIFVLKRLGFLIASSVYLYFQILLCQGKTTKREALWNILLSVCLSAAVYFLFSKGFSLILPQGILG